MKELPFSLLNTLRSGDVVEISFADIDGSKPSEVTILKVDNSPDVGEDGQFGATWLTWGQDAKVEQEAIGLCLHSGFASARFVTRIVSRAGRSGGDIKNYYFGKTESYGTLADVAVHRSGKMVAAHPLSLVGVLLARYPDLMLPYGVSTESFWHEWERSGYIGARGSFDRWKSVLKQGRPERSGDGGLTFGQIGLVWWLHLPTFKRWLLRRLPHIAKTKAEVRLEGIAEAKRFHQSYRSDLDYDDRREAETDDDLHPSSYEMDYA